jgi:hypothetical protein
VPRAANGAVTASAAELRHCQRFLPGTTAWRISHNRRQVVEGVNGMLKGGFVNIQHKFFRVFGLTKTKLLLAFTVVGYKPRGHPLVPREEVREGGRRREEPGEEEEAPRGNMDADSRIT